jgi:hypothetical protein
VNRANVVTRTNTRCQALSLSLINYGKTRMVTSGLQTLQSLKEGADYPNYWGQETKRHLDAKRPCTNNRPRTVGNTGEVHFSHLDGGGRQRARSTRLPEGWGNKKRFFLSLLGTGEGA